MSLLYAVISYYIMYYYVIKEESDNRFWTWDRHWLILDAHATLSADVSP